MFKSANNANENVLMVFIKKTHNTKQILSKYVNISPSTFNFSKSFLKISISLMLQETLISRMLHDFILQCFCSLLGSPYQAKPIIILDTLKSDSL